LRQAFSSIKQDPDTPEEQEMPAQSTPSLMSQLMSLIGLAPAADTDCE
jgi:hypothetical protein